MPKRSERSPRTKAELLDKILSYDFHGDLRQLSPDPSQATIKRTSSNTLDVDFRDTDTHFQIVVRRPRGEQMKHAHAGMQSGKAAAQGSQSKSPKKKPKVVKLATVPPHEITDDDFDV